MEFITIRDPFGGDANRKSLNIHHGVNITDDFMERVETLSTKELSKTEMEEINKWVTYHPSGVTRVESVKDIFEKILETRLQTGEPYLHFIDTSNKHLPKPQRDLGMTVKQSNLCAEIIETTGTDYLGVNRTAICCLASVNISKYDEWKDKTQFIEDITEFLDNVIEKFIANASKIDGLEDVVHAAKMERSIGIGAMGFHDYLQQKMIAFESPMAVGINKKIFGFIHENAKKASMRLAQERGACPDYEEWLKRCLPSAEDIANNPPVRGMNLTAIAPNACQSKSNLVKTVNDVKTVGEILLDAGVDVNGLEIQNKKQWVYLVTPIEIETLNGIREIEKVWYNGNDDELYELEFPDGCVYRFTGKHRLMVKTDESWDWKEVRNLTEDDDILTEEEFKLLNLKF